MIFLNFTLDDWSGYAADTNDDDDRLTISIRLLFDIDKRFGGEIRYVQCRVAFSLISRNKMGIRSRRERAKKEGKKWGDVEGEFRAACDAPLQRLQNNVEGFNALWKMMLANFSLTSFLFVPLCSFGKTYQEAHSALTWSHSIP